MKMQEEMLLAMCNETSDQVNADQSDENNDLSEVYKLLSHVTS
jgi:hypothetical protein